LVDKCAAIIASYMKNLTSEEVEQVFKE
jgi:hypothetical protein